MSKFHICTQMLQGNALFSGKNLHSWKQFYTSAGRDGRDKFQVWGLSITILTVRIYLLTQLCTQKNLCGRHLLIITWAGPFGPLSAYRRNLDGGLSISWTPSSSTMALVVLNSEHVGGQNESNQTGVGFFFGFRESGWQDLAGFRRGQTWPWNLSSSA